MILWKNYAFTYVGARYPIIEKDLTILQSNNFKHTDKRCRGLPLSLDLKGAHKTLNKFFSTKCTRKQREARWRLLRACKCPEVDHTPGLLIKVSNDVDLVLFGGLLRNRVRVRWDNTPTDLEPGNMYFGCLWDAIWLRQHVERTSIVLNASVDF